MSVVGHAKMQSNVYHALHQHAHHFHPPYQTCKHWQEGSLVVYRDTLPRTMNSSQALQNHSKGSGLDSNALGI